jgi:hypothetical protein
MWRVGIMPVRFVYGLPWALGDELFEISLVLILLMTY